MLISDTSVVTHNFPSLKERTKTLSFFSVTSSWQSGDVTLLQTGETGVQMRRKRGKLGESRKYIRGIMMLVVVPEKRLLR